MVILIVQFYNQKIHLVWNPQNSAVSTYDPHLVRIHLVRKFFAQSSALSEDLLYTILIKQTN